MTSPSATAAAEIPLAAWTRDLEQSSLREGRLLQPRGPAIALPAGFSLAGAAAERAASRVNVEPRAPRS